MKLILSMIPMLSLLLSGVGLFLSLWIVLSAPIATEKFLAWALRSSSRI